MAAKKKIEENEAATGLALLREPFPDNLISHKPVFTRRQLDEADKNPAVKFNCKVCGGYHHKDAKHLPYVGHAALTDRLLDCDPNWNWEPVALNQNGLPMLDADKGLWIRLTVCDQTRLGYGHADGKKGGDAMKEVIGDALRNAAMRFGAALDLWHKGDFWGDGDEPEDPPEDPPKFNARATTDRIKERLNAANDVDDLAAAWKDEQVAIKAVSAVDKKMLDEIESVKNERRSSFKDEKPKTDIQDEVNLEGDDDGK